MQRDGGKPHAALPDRAWSIPATGQTIVASSSTIGSDLPKIHWPGDAAAGPGPSGECYAEAFADGARGALQRCNIYIYIYHI